MLKMCPSSCQEECMRFGCESVGCLFFIFLFCSSSRELKVIYMGHHVNRGKTEGKLKLPHEDTLAQEVNSFRPGSQVYTFGSHCVFATLDRNGLKQPKFSDHEVAFFGMTTITISCEKLFIFHSPDLYILRPI